MERKENLKTLLMSFRKSSLQKSKANTFPFLCFRNWTCSLIYLVYRMFEIEII